MGPAYALISTDKAVSDRISCGLLLCALLTLTYENDKFRLSESSGWLDWDGCFIIVELLRT